MSELDLLKPVVVTGATGYVAGWLIAELLDLGLTVHACVRDPDDRDKLKYLNALVEEKRGELKYFKADLLVEGSYLPAMVGAEYVFHTASPFNLEAGDAQKDFVDPALKGTLNVLSAVDQTESVKRVVLTSSVTATICDNIQVAQSPEGKINEDHWNTYASIDHNPYHYSKKVAEEAAWSVVKKQARWDLVVINPSLVVGPALNPDAGSGSFELIAQFVDGAFKWGVPKIGVGVVDVRDVAHAHVQAAFSRHASGRYLVSGRDSSFMDIADMLRDKFGDQYPLPTSFIPKFLAWLFAPLAGVSRLLVKRNFGYMWYGDNAKSVKDLQMQYQNPEAGLNRMLQQYIDSGRLNK